MCSLLPSPLFNLFPSFLTHYFYYLFQICPSPHSRAWPLISCLHFLFFLPFILPPPASVFTRSPFSVFRVTWLPALVNQGQMSTTPWCCITITAPAGQSTSSCPSRWTCSGGLTSGSSSGTAPVSGNKIVDMLY